MGLPHKNLFKIGYKIKAYRLANKLTQEQLADMMNCNFKTIGNLENDRTMPDLKQVINLCDILGITMDELFVDAFTKTAEPLVAEPEDTYPPLVKRQVTADSINKLHKIELLSQKIKKLSEKELNIADTLIDSLLKYR